MKGVGGIRALALAVALGTRGFSGAQTIARAADESRPLNFDPLALLRRRPNRERPHNSTNSRKPHCGAKQRAKYKRNPLTHDYHADRMAWMAQPRIKVAMERRARDQERAGRTWPQNYRNSGAR